MVEADQVSSGAQASVGQAEVHAARSERWFAEKGIEWQTVVLGQLSSRAQSVLSLSLTVPPLLLGAGTLAIINEEKLATLANKLTIAFLGLGLVVTAFLAFAQALAVLYPRASIAWPTPRGFFDSVVSTHDQRSPEASVDRTVAEILRRRIIENNKDIALLRTMLCKATYNLGMSVCLGISFVVFVALVLLMQM